MSSETVIAEAVFAEAGIADDEAWQAVQTRDRRHDGRFVTGVLTTGIYCRPSCPARHPLRAHVRFFADGPAARTAGLRPCLRCAPDDASREEQAVTAALAMIRDGIGDDAPPTLTDLAARVDYSPAHFQRIFRRATGVSPAAYARALRMDRARAALRAGGRVTDAVYDAGFGAASRFYAAAGKRLGMSPSAWAQGGREVVIRWAVADTPFGAMLIAATDKGICRLSFGEGRPELSALFPNAELVAGGEELAELLTQVLAAMEQPALAATIPLDVRGTAFQEAVWQELQRIPPGETRSYAQIATAVGKPAAVRATGSANGANPVAVLVPCHRVIRSDGSLGGYAYGLEIKQALLDRERVGRR